MSETIDHKELFDSVTKSIDNALDACTDENIEVFNITVLIDDKSNRLGSLFKLNCDEEQVSEAMAGLLNEHNGKLKDFFITAMSAYSKYEMEKRDEKDVNMN